jgi:type I restriction enzyme, S subunit
MMEKKKDVEDWTPSSPNVAEHWEVAEFEDLLQNVSTNGIKIPQKAYLSEGKFPVIDQGQDLIGGYTNATDKVLEGLGSVVVFGDHTRCFKPINFPFAPGADGVKVLKPVSEVDPKFIYYSLKTVNLPNRGYSRHYSFLKKSKLPLCSLEEQKIIVEILDKTISKIDQMEDDVDIQLKKSEALRQSILKKAFSGKLVAQDPTDEPASVLLERIKAEKQKPTKKRKAA